MSRTMNSDQFFNAITAAMADGWILQPDEGYQVEYYRQDSQPCKIRTQTNWMDAFRLACKYVTLEVGLPCTICIGSDRYAAEITYVSPAMAYVMVRCGTDDDEERFSLRKNGEYRSGKSTYLTLGTAHTYRDPSF